jgi:hypothetical protein
MVCLSHGESRRETFAENRAAGARGANVPGAGACPVRGRPHSEPEQPTAHTAKAIASSKAFCNRCGSGGAPTTHQTYDHNKIIH